MWSNLFTHFLVPLNQKSYTFKEKKKKRDTIVLTVILKRKKNWYQKTLSTQVEVFYVKYQARESSKLIKKKKKITKAK